MSKCQSKGYSPKGVTTYYQYFSGSGEICLTDEGHLSGTVGVYVLYDTSPDRSSRYYQDGEPVELHSEGDCVELKYTGDYILIYQIQNCYTDDVVFEQTPIDYTNGFVPPLPDLPVFTGTIPDITGDEGVAITPYDASTHFSEGAP